MTKRKALSRDVDNRRLSSLFIGETFVPRLGHHVTWEGLGERAASNLLALLPGLQQMVSQPGRLRVEGRWWHPDYGAAAAGRSSLLVEVKGHAQLGRLSVREKVKAADIEAGQCGKRLVVLNARHIAYSTELRNVLLLRRYGRRNVPKELVDSLLSGFSMSQTIPLHALVTAVEYLPLVREDVYALLYQGVLDMDWTKLLTDDTPLSAGTPASSPEVLPSWLANLLTASTAVKVSCTEAMP